MTRTYSEYPKWVAPHASWVVDGGHAAYHSAAADFSQGFQLRSVGPRERPTVAAGLSPNYQVLVSNAREEAKFTGPKP
jgi:hypothetical protein